MSNASQINKIRQLAATQSGNKIGLKRKSDDYLSVMMVLVRSYGLENFANHVLIDKYDVFDYRQLNPAEASEFISIIDAYLRTTIEARTQIKRVN